MPAFMKSFDEYLLKKHPHLWSLRVHLFAYYALLINGIFAILCTLFPFDLFNAASHLLFTGFMCIIVIIGIIVWMYYLQRFNAFKIFGKRYGKMSALLAYLSFITVFIITLFSIYIPSFIVKCKANKKYPTAIITNDINEINRAVYLLCKDSLTSPWQSSDVSVKENKALFFDTIDEKIIRFEPVKEIIEHDYDQGRNNYMVYYQVLDSFLLSQDSFTKIDVNNYKIFDCADYLCIDGINSNIYPPMSIYDGNYQPKTLKTLSNLEIYQLYRNASPLKNDSLLAMQLLLKYSNITKEDSIRALDQAQSEDINNRIFDNFFHFRYQVNQNINELINIKEFYAYENLFEWLILPISFIFGLALLLFIYRHGNIWAFLLSAVISALLLIFWALIGAFFRFDDDEIFALYLLNLIVMGILSYRLFFMKYRTNFYGAFVNVFVCALYAFVLSSSFFIFEKMDDVYDYDYEFEVKIRTAIFLFQMLSSFFIIPFIAFPLYRRWYSLPEKN